MKYFITFIATLIGGVIYFNRTPPPDLTPKPPGTHPNDHIIRITALLEFDGKPVVVDELITCLAEAQAAPPLAASS